MPRGRRSAPVLVLASALLLPLACGVPSLPRPPLGPHTPADFSSVAVPPPSPRPQELPARPSTTTVWVDAEWVAAGDNAWVWQPGGWITPPAGGRLALWSLDWLPDGRLRYAPSVFHLPDGSSVPLASLLGLLRGPGAQPPCPPSAPPYAPLASFVPSASLSVLAPLAPLPSMSVAMPPLPAFSSQPEGPSSRPPASASASASASAPPRSAPSARP